ncbi:hypothetical protein QCA50_009785 [Cerrena zonata]|uniref:Uncharacterized protein n=1 Tax=Cerrena zonata TaxID=2478898 RepID=A0AAW0GE02_9APHY
MSGDPQTLHIINHVYGTAPGNGVEAGNHKHLEAQLQIRIPDAEYGTDATRFVTWAATFTRSTCIDLKHSDKWHCEYCGKRARGQIPIIAAWTHSTPPKMVMCTYLVCDVNSSCGDQAREAIREDAPGAEFPPETPGSVYPQAAGCANCKSDASAENDLRRCTSCKLIRLVLDTPYHSLNIQPYQYINICLDTAGRIVSKSTGADTRKYARPSKRSIGLRLICCLNRLGLNIPESF